MTYAQKIAAQAGLVRTISFDASILTQGIGYDSGFFINSGQTNPTAAVLDTGNQASGQNSIKFIVPSQSSSGASGQIFLDFAADKGTQFGAGQTFWLQWQQKWDRYIFEHSFLDSEGMKQAIITWGDPQTCTPSSQGTCVASNNDSLTVVLQNNFQRGYPQVYNYNLDPDGHTFAWEETFGGDFKMQNAIPSPYCLYLNNGLNCLHYSDGLATGGDQVTQWATITWQFTLGALSGGAWAGSNIKQWWSWNGATARQLWDWTTDLKVTGSEKYGKLWLLPYQTNKNPSEVHNVTYTWYANPIVATSAIPLTTDEVASKPVLVMR